MADEEFLGWEYFSAQRLGAALRTATAALIDELEPAGHWKGELSSSALSTATAVTALAAMDRVAHAEADRRRPSLAG